MGGSLKKLVSVSTGPALQSFSPVVSKNMVLATHSKSTCHHGQLRNWLRGHVSQCWGPELGASLLNRTSRRDHLQTTVDNDGLRREK